MLDELRDKIIENQLLLLKQLPWQKDGCSLSYHTLLQYLTVNQILQWNPQLPQSCLMAMNDRGLAPEASYLYCVLCHKHSEEEKCKEKWINIWLKPVIEALDSSTSLHRFLIAEYILPKILKGHSDYLEDLKSITGDFYLNEEINKFENNLVNPRTLIVCTRIGRSLGFCRDIFSSNNIIEHDLIRQGITSDDEQVFIGIILFKNNLFKLFFFKDLS